MDKILIASYLAHRIDVDIHNAMYMLWQEIKDVYCIDLFPFEFKVKQYGVHDDDLDGTFDEDIEPPKNLKRVLDKFIEQTYHTNDFLLMVKVHQTKWWEEQYVKELQAQHVENGQVVSQPHALSDTEAIGQS